MKLLQGLYCRYYQLMISVRNSDIPEFASMVLMTFILTVNLFTIYMISTVVGHMPLLPTPVGISAMIALFFILYFSLVYNGRSSKILERYEDETRRARFRGRILLIIYLVLSVASLVGSFMLKMFQSRGEL